MGYNMIKEGIIMVDPVKDLEEMHVCPACGEESFGNECTWCDINEEYDWTGRE